MTYFKQMIFQRMETQIQAQTMLTALEGLTKTNGFHTTIVIRAKYAEKQDVLMKEN